jgi:hypothetical protein
MALSTLGDEKVGSPTERIAGSGFCPTSQFPSPALERIRSRVTTLPRRPFEVPIEYRSGDAPQYPDMPGQGSIEIPGASAFIFIGNSRTCDRPQFREELRRKALEG